MTDELRAAPRTDAGKRLLKWEREGNVPWDVALECILEIEAATPEPAPDVEPLDVERLAREAFDKTMEHVEPWASGPVSAKHGALFVRNLRAALHPADPSRTP